LAELFKILKLLKD